MKQVNFSPDDLPYKLVNFGVDTLVLNVRYEEDKEQPGKVELPERLVSWLNGWQALAREQEEPVETPLVFHEEMHLFMYAHGGGKGQWRWILNCPAFKLYVGRGRLGGVVAQVRFAASYLWSCEKPGTHEQDIWLPIVRVTDFLDEFLSDSAGTICVQVSEIHLCADITGWDVSTCDWQTSFLSRARKRTDRAEEVVVAGGPSEVVIAGRRLATLTFGSHGSALSCCVYNKSLEIKVSQKQWFEEVWRRRGWDGESEVWRIEFRWKREALHEIKQEGVFHGIETLDDLVHRLSYLWTYCAGHTQIGEKSQGDGWLRFASPSNDSNLARWSVHPAWRVVQSAFCEQTEQAVNVSTGEVFETPASPLVELIRERQRQINLERLALQVGGCASTFSSWLSERGTDKPLNLVQVFAWLIEKLPEYSLGELAGMEDKGVTPDLLKAEYRRLFEEKVFHKQVLYGRRVKLEL